MERSRMKQVWAESRFQDYLNPGPEPEAMNRKTVASAYGALGLSFDVPNPAGDLAQAPDNTLGPEAYSQGWFGAFQSGAKPWL